MAYPNARGTTSNGGKYVSLTLRDGSGAIPAVAFDDCLWTRHYDGDGMETDDHRALDIVRLADRLSGREFG